MPSLLDFFARPDTASGLGSTPDGRPWVVITGAWRIANGQPISSTTATLTSGPIAVVNLPESPDAFTLQCVIGPGDAMYFRVQNALNWWRLRHSAVQSSTSTSVVEHEWSCLFGGAFLAPGSPSNPSTAWIPNHTHFATLSWQRADVTGNPCGILLDHSHSQAPHRHTLISASKTGNTRPVTGGSFVSYIRTMILEVSVNGLITQRGSWSNLADFLIGGIVISNNTTIAAYADTTFLGSVTSDVHATRTQHGIGYVQSPYTAHNLDSFSLKWSNLAPASPTLLSPVSNATINLDGPVLFSWQFNDPDDTQASWMFFRKLLNAQDGQYWNKTTGAFQTSPVINVGSEQSFLFPAGTWDNDETYQWNVATADSHGVMSSFALLRRLTGGDAPVVTITGPPDIVTDTTRPLITWTFFSEQARAQQSYELKLFTEEQALATNFNPSTNTALWTSGTVFSSTVRAHSLGFDAVAGIQYRIYIRATDSVALQSQWSFGEFIVDLEGPSAPALSIVNEPNSGRVLLTVVSTHDPDDFPNCFITIDRFTPSGWAHVRGAAELALGTSTAVSAYDWEATPGVSTIYRAKTTAIIATSFIASVEAFGQIFIDSNVAWLKDPVDPLFNQIISLRSVPTITREQERGIYEAIGRSDPVVVYGARRTARGSVEIFCGDYAKRMAINSLVDNRRTLLLQIPSRRVGEPGEQWYIRPITATTVSPHIRTYGTPWDTVIEFSEVLPPPPQLFVGPVPPEPAQAAIVQLGGDAVVSVSTGFTRVGTAISDTPITSWTWTIQSGPAQVGTVIGTAQTVTWTPTVLGTYVIRLTVITEGIQSFDEMSVLVISGTISGGTGLVTPDVGTIV